MKIKHIIKHALFALLGVMTANVATAQHPVKGSVFDKTNPAMPLSGVVVVVEGTKISTLSDATGNFTINAPSSESVLEFRSMGYISQKIKAGFGQLQVFLEESATSLEEVIVTALGVTRQEKTLGYSVQKVQGEMLIQSVSSNWVSNLNGKVPGLSMFSGGTGPGGQQRVTLRGDASLNYSNNQALFVVDGVPILNSSTATTSGSNYSATAAVDFGDNISDINPDNIESVSVLKGPSASALYGSRAMNGVILITTKRGRAEKGWGVTLNTSILFENAMRHPDFQKEYGSSAGSTLLTNTHVSVWGLPGSMTEDGQPRRRQFSYYTYGEKYDPNEKRYLYQSKNWDTGEFTPVPWVYADDWFTGFFETGVTKTTSITVQGNSGNGTTGRFSYTNKDLSSWIIPMVSYKQNNFSMVLDHVVNKHITLFSNINYVRRTSDQMPMSGYYYSSPMYCLIWGYTVTPISCFRDEYMKGRYTREIFELGSNPDLYNVQSALIANSLSARNPYRTIYEELNTLERNRVYGNLGVDINIIENLNLRLRGGLDMNNEFRTQRRPKMTSSNIDGMYREQSVTEYDINTDFLLTYNKSFGKLSGIVGFGGNDRRWNKRLFTAEAPELDLEGPDMYTLANSAVPVVSSSNFSAKAIQSLYGYLNFAWDDAYFLDITARNDWSSTLKPQYWSYFYPSVSASVLLNEAFNINSRTIDLLKLRVSWSNVGNDMNPYQTAVSYGNTSYPGGFAMPTTLYDPYIRPERVKSIEAGLDVRLFANRLSVDMALYENRSYDQIILIPLSIETGAGAIWSNGADVQNRGIELLVRGVPVRSKNVTWELFANWSKNKNVLIEYAMDSDRLQHNIGTGNSYNTSIGSRVYVNSFEGEEMYWIYGSDYVRAPQGSTYIDDSGNTIDCSGAVIVNASTGYPSLTPPDQRIARVDPKWKGGFGTTVRYKSLSMSANFTAQMGGHSFSVTNFALAYQGKLKNSLEGRPAGLVIDGVNAIDDPDTGKVSYVKNHSITDNVYEYYAAVKWVRDNTYENTFSTDFLKCKELRIEYAIPRRWVEQTRILQGASVAAFATNLFCITPWPQYDPEEANAISGSGNRNEINILRGMETGVFPMTRTFGFNVKLQF